MESRVLIAAYYFPPSGGAGTQRFAKFCKYLPEHGLRPIVVTRGGTSSNESAPQEDPSLEIGEETEIHRVPPDPFSPFERILRGFNFFLDEEPWVRAATRRALEICAAERPSCVLTTASPYAVYRLGEAVRRRFDIPWLLDLRDPWALDGWRFHRTPLHLAFDLREMRRALRSCDVVIANTKEAARAYVELGVDPARVVTIPNGYDEEDFVGVEQRQPEPSPRLFRLVHVGTLHSIDRPPGLTRNGLWCHRARQIEPLGRTGFYLFHALALLRDRDSSAFSSLRVELYGRTHPSHSRLARELGLEDVVFVGGYLPHRDSVAALVRADALFVPLHGIPPGERALVVPGKLYEALASGRPVLAALPPGDGADLVRATRAGTVVSPTDAPSIAAALTQLLHASLTVRCLPAAPQAAFAAYSRRALTSRLAGTLRSLLTSPVATASAVAIRG